MKKRNILFLPSDRGGGFGHISRCLSLAREARRRGHASSFVLSSTAYANIINTEFPTLLAQPVARRSTPLSLMKQILPPFASPRTALFTEITGLDFQVIRDGFTDRNSVHNAFTRYLAIVNTIKPDLLVGDTNLLVWMLGGKTGIPVVQIVRYASHPSTARLVWWKDLPEELIPPDTPALFNVLLTQLNLEPIVKAEDLLKGQLYIVPSIPEFEPIPPDNQTAHVGHLTETGEPDTDLPWMKEIDTGKPLIYITIGGGAKTVGNISFFRTIIESLAEQPIEAVVSTGHTFRGSPLPPLPPHIRFFTWLPGKQIIARSDLVVFHGGYGTMMECIVFGKPVITIPFHSEQEGNGRRLEQLGCGPVIRLSREKPQLEKAAWKYGSYSYLVQRRYDLTADELRETVRHMLSSQRYAAAAGRLQSRLKEYGGPEEAMDIIESRWTNGSWY